jgi:hypothetical protein
MRTALILITIILASCTPKTYLEKAENEITIDIDKRLTINDSTFNNELEVFFENYINSNQIVDSNEDKGLIYYNYLKFVIEHGGGLNKIVNDTLTTKIKNELKTIGLDSEIGIQNLFYETVKPIVDKYHGELIDRNLDNELILGIAETNPIEEMNMTVVMSGLIKNYKYNDFNRPFLKKFVMLFVFVQLELNE